MVSGSFRNGDGGGKGGGGDADLENVEASAVNLQIRIHCKQGFQHLQYCHPEVGVGSFCLVSATLYLV